MRVQRPVLDRRAGYPQRAYATPCPGAAGRSPEQGNGSFFIPTPAPLRAMPEGTPIIAARSSRVVKIENDQAGRGNDA